MRDLLLSWLMMLCIFGMVWSWMRYGPPWGIFGCAFFHRRKRYVGIQWKRHPIGICNDAFCRCEDRGEKPYTVARWICDACRGQGEKRINRGRWTIEHGEVVPDEKALANSD